MKKICQLFCICAVLVFFVNASVWEGAGAAASGTELPETGLYISTNSFPGNTVVDVTNLENGKTVRAIVSSGLDTPGLLAVLSKDAAEAIGLPGRSLGRIRMTQPADTIAFSRFTDGTAVSGDPDYDPAAFVALNGHNPDAAEKAADEAPEMLAAGEHGRMESGDLIVDIPGGEAASSVPDAALVPAAAAPLVVLVDPEAEEESEAVPEETPLATAETAPAAPAAAVVPDVVEDEGITREKGPVIAEAPAEAAEFVPVPVAPLALLETEAETPLEPETPVEQAAAEPEYDLSLVPAETRPPENGLEPDPYYFIPGIVPAAEEGTPRDTYIDPALVIEPANPPLAQTSPAENVPMEYIPAIPLDVTPAESFSPAVPAAAFAPSASDPVFSAPFINSLEKGKYYLQLAAYSKAETVHSELARIDNKLPLAVMPAGSADKPVYRILIGPVNLGESGALLQRFKGTHKDAFVRLGT